MDKRHCYWVKIKDGCSQTAIRLISFGVYSLRHNYPIKICRIIGYDNKELAVVIDTSIGNLDIPVCIKIEDTEPLSFYDISKMDFLDEKLKNKIYKEVVATLEQV